MNIEEKIAIINEAIISDSYLYFAYEKGDLSKRNFFGYIKEIKQVDGIVYFLITGYIERTDEFLDFTIRLDRIISVSLPKEKTKSSICSQEKERLLVEIGKLTNEREEFFNKSSEDRFCALMSYYIEAQKSDRRVLIPSRKLVKGVDLDVLSDNIHEGYYLNEAQFKSLYKVIVDQVSESGSDEWLYINELSLRIRDKVFVIAYHNVFFDIEKRKLKYGENIEFNGLIFSEDVIGTPFRLRDGFEVSDFIEAYRHDKDEAISMIELIASALIDTSPLCLSLEETSTFISNSLSQIIKSFDKGYISTPICLALGLDHERQSIDSSLFTSVSTNDSQLAALNMVCRNPISYIYGPPGTGKSHTIMESVISCLFKGTTALVSSNANHPLDEIALKLREYRVDRNLIIFPYFRLGNIDVMCEEIDRIRSIYKSIEGKKIPNMRREVMLFLESMTKNYSWYNSSGSAELQRFSPSDVKHAKMLQYLTLTRLSRIFQYPHLAEVIFYKGESEEDVKNAVRKLSSYCRSYEGFQEFIDVFPIVLSTAYSTAKLPAMADIFDIVFLDEAASCPIVSGILPLFRGKKAVLLGDQEQLQSFSIIDERIDRLLINKHKIPTEYSFSNKSILEIVSFNNKNLARTMLTEHYRCQKDIIDFCNREFYDDKMTICTLKDEDEHHLFVVDLDSPLSKDNSSIEEADYIATDIILRGLNPSSVAIITPFVRQVDIIKKALKTRFDGGEIKVGTVHGFQGDQKDYIYFSLACSKATSKKTLRNFVSDRYLVNVAISRARKLFVAVGDFSLLARLDDEDNILNKLYIYSKNLGTVIVPRETRILNEYKIEKKGSVGGLTQTEADFKRILSQVISVFDERKLTLKTHVILTSFFPELKEDNKYENFHFDFVVGDLEENLFVAFELDGLEHRLNKEKILNDLKKDSLLVRYPNLKIVRVNNRDRNQYVRIKQLVFSSFSELESDKRKPKKQ